MIKSPFWKTDLLLEGAFIFFSVITLIGFIAIILHVYQLISLYFPVGLLGVYLAREQMITMWKKRISEITTFSDSLFQK